MSGRTMIRNKAIARAFKEAGLIESFGTGIRKMRSLCEMSGTAVPEIKEDGIYFIVTFSRKAENDSVASVAENVKGMTGTESRVYAIICKGSLTTAKEMSAASGVSEKSVRRIIDSLIRKELIQRIGSDRSGKWIRK